MSLLYLIWQQYHSSSSIEHQTRGSSYKLLHYTFHIYEKKNFYALF